MTTFGNILRAEQRSTATGKEDFTIFDMAQREVVQILSRDILHRFKLIAISEKLTESKDEVTASDSFVAKLVGHSQFWFFCKAIKLFGKALVETKTDSQGKMQVKILDAEDGSGFDDLPALHGKCKIRFVRNQVYLMDALLYHLKGEWDRRYARKNPL